MSRVRTPLPAPHVAPLCAADANDESAVLSRGRSAKCLAEAKSLALREREGARDQVSGQGPSSSRQPVALPGREQKRKRRAQAVDKLRFRRVSSPSTKQTGSGLGRAFMRMNL